LFTGKLGYLMAGNRTDKMVTAVNDYGGRSFTKIIREE
jgi:hypothetical protein